MSFTKQETLTQDAPMILDATASFGRIWPAFATLRMDVRRIVRPDIVASATALPFRDGVFDQIYCDPPHIIYPFDPTNDSKKVSTFRPRYVRFREHIRFDMAIRFGFWKSKEEWANFVAKSGPEFKRTLKESGTLFYKITDDGDRRQRVSHKHIAEMRFITIKDRVTRSRSNLRRKNKVHWLTLKPKPRALQESLEREGERQ